MSLLAAPYNEVALGAVSGAQAFDGSKGNFASMTATGGNITLTLSNLRIGQFYAIAFTQDGGGSRTLTLAGFTNKNGTITAPTITGGVTSVYMFICVSATEIAGGKITA